MTAEKYPPVSPEAHRRQMAAVIRRTAALVVKMAAKVEKMADSLGRDYVDAELAEIAMAADDLAHQLDVLARPIGMAVAPGAIVNHPSPDAPQGRDYVEGGPAQIIEPTRARRVIHDPALTGTWEPPEKPLSEMIAEARRQPEDPRLPKERDDD